MSLSSACEREKRILVLYSPSRLVYAIQTHHPDAALRCLCDRLKSARRVYEERTKSLSCPNIYTRSALDRRCALHRRALLHWIQLICSAQSGCPGRLAAEPSLVSSGTSLFEYETRQTRKRQPAVRKSLPSCRQGYIARRRSGIFAGDSTAHHLRWPKGCASGEIAAPKIRMPDLSARLYGLPSPHSLPRLAEQVKVA